MKFQTKLLLLLLTVALVPLCLSFAAQQISVSYFGDKIAEDARERMEESARSLLQTLTADYAHILHRDRSLAEMALHIQAQAVTSRLRADPPSSPPPVYYAEDYTSPQEQPGDLTTTDKYRQTDSRGKAHSIPVSFTQQTIYLAPGVDKEQVQDQVRRLSTMPDVYRTLHNIQPELFLWQYTALESGMHVSYPGKGAYPSSYDPRERLWYMLALDHGGQIEQIMTDVSTGSMILTMAMPIHSRDGSVAGVTALDIDYRQFFADWNIPDQWSQSMDCMVVAYRPGRRRAPNRQLEILLRNRKEDVNRDWRIPVEQKFLDLPAEHLNALLEDIRAGRSGIRRMPYQGQEALWAYGSRTDNEPFPVAVVPYREVIAQALTAEEHITHQMNLGLSIAAVLTVLAVLLAIGLAVVRSRKLTESVQELAVAANRLSDGDFETKVQTNYCRELNELGDVFNCLGPRLQEREEMKQSLELARIIQQRLLPDQAPPCPGFDLTGMSQYCQETGGDYYDFIFLGQDSLHHPALALGDVSGHGVGTALVMATARAMLHALAMRHGSDLNSLFSELNSSLCRDTEDTYFMTMFYGVLDCEQATLEWISAGHAPLFLYRSSGEIHHLDSSGIPLGVMEHSTFEAAEPIVFDPGDILLACSDGVWECTNPDGEMFGTERVDSLLLELAEVDADGICRTFLQELEHFRQGEAPNDDITLMVIKATG